MLPLTLSEREVVFAGDQILLKVLLIREWKYPERSGVVII
jgi:hypothetical protein